MSQKMISKWSKNISTQGNVNYTMIYHNIFTKMASIKKKKKEKDVEQHLLIHC